MTGELGVAELGALELGGLDFFEEEGSPVTISCNNPPVGFVQVPYSHAFPASEGTEPYTFAIAAGTLPPGLTLGASTGIVSGTPTTKGTYEFTIEVTDDDDETAEVECSITIRAKCLLADVS